MQLWWTEETLLNYGSMSNGKRSLRFSVSVWLEVQAPHSWPLSSNTPWHLSVGLFTVFSVIAAVAQLFRACAGWSCCSSLSIQTIWGHLPGKAFYACHLGAGFHQQTLPNSSCTALCSPSVKSWALNELNYQYIYRLKQKWKFKPLHLINAGFWVVPWSGRAFTSCWSWQPDCVAKVRVICEVGRRNSDF